MKLTSPKSNPEKILLLGGAGYIGPVVADHLIQSGYHVTIFDNLIYQQYQSTSALFLKENFEFLNGDMADLVSIKQTLKGFEKVIILGGLVGDPITKKYASESYLINEQAIINLIDELDVCGIKQVVFVSTCSNYGLMTGEQLANEDTNLNPLSHYAKAKVKAEKHLLSKKGSVKYVATILRFATAFGLSPRMRFDLTVNQFTRDIYLKKHLLVYDANTWRPYCHVKDFARLLEIVFVTNKDLVNFEIFNAGGDENNRTKKSLIEEIAQFLPCSNIKYEEGGNDPRNYRVDFSKAKNILGFVPNYDIHYGIKEVVAALKAGIFDDVDQNKTYYGNYELLNFSP